MVAEIEQEIIKQYNRGVCCFSAVMDNPLLWSHYANEHKGFCIGYSLARVPEPKLHKVVYGGSRSVKTSLIARALLENDYEAQNLLDQDVLLRKAPSWRYEREWRLLGDRGVQRSPLELADVTFGLRCPEAIKYAVVSVLNPRAIKFFEMYELAGTFNLKRRLLNTDELCAYFPNIARSAIEIFGPEYIELTNCSRFDRRQGAAAGGGIVHCRGERMAARVHHRLQYAFWPGPGECQGLASPADTSR
jgi:hypothetical protein